MMCVHSVLEHARPRLSAVCAVASGRSCAMCADSCVPLLPPDDHARGQLDHGRCIDRLACRAAFLDQVDQRTSSGSCGRSGSRTSRSHTKAQAERLSERIMWKAGTMRWWVWRGSAAVCGRSRRRCACARRTRAIRRCRPSEAASAPVRRGHSACRMPWERPALNCPSGEGVAVGK